MTTTNTIKSKPKSNFKLALHWQILIAMVLGIGFGLTFSNCANSLDNRFCLTLNHSWISIETFAWMGEVFLKLLKMIVVPLIFCSLINGISHMKVEQLGKVGFTTFIVFKVSMLIAAVIGLFYVNLIQPGVGFDVSSISKIDLDHLNTNPNNHNFLLGIIPSNIFAALADDHKLIQVIFFAILLGIALVTGGKQTISISKAIEQLFNVMLRITHWIMTLAPFGVFGLIVKTIGHTGIEPFISISKYMLVVILALSTMLFIVTPLAVYFIGRMSPLKFFGGIKEAMLTAFGTSSSAATVPVTLECVQKNLGISSSLSSFVVTIGSTMSMNGAALYEAVVTLFLAQAYAASIPSIDLSLKGQIFIVAMVLLSTLGTPGIPHGGLVTTTIVLKAVGLPIDAIGLIIGVDRILDMCRTMTNVTGDCAAAVMVSRFVKDDEWQMDAQAEEEVKEVEDENKMFLDSTHTNTKLS